jgi:para-aminobenzoate synthetase component I
VHPYRLVMDWIDPLDVVAAGVVSNDWAVMLAGAGDHPLARWSYLGLEPVVTALHGAEQAVNLFPVFERGVFDTGVTHDPDGPPFQGGWIGVCAYELAHAVERFERPLQSLDGSPHDWPDFAFGLYDTIAAFDRLTQTVHVLSCGLSEHSERPSQRRAIARVNALVSLLRSVPSLLESRPFQAKGDGQLATTTDEAAFHTALEKTVAYIRAGDIFQANLSLCKTGQLRSDDHPSDLFVRLMKAHPAPFGSLMFVPSSSADGRLTDHRCALVSHAPERFLSLSNDGVLETRPIKGTRPRDPDPVIDAANAAALAMSEKDRAENLMIVDLMRNDLARVAVAGSVKVPRLMGLEAFSTVHHMVSDVQSQLTPGKTAFDALKAAFPPGSITGAPKVRAMEIISEMEGEPRGPWCGSMVWIGWDGAMDSSVLIRTAACYQKLNDDQPWSVVVRGGAGIVADSDPAAEIAEMHLKTKALAWAVTGKDGAYG